MNKRTIPQIVLALVVAASLLIGTTASLFAEEVKVPKPLKEDVRKALARIEKDGPEEHEFIEKLKKAGASYYPELTAIPEKAQQYQDKEKQRMMVGVYLMDMSWAMVFGKNKDSLKYAEAIDSLLTRLGFSNKKVVRQYGKFVKDFSGPNAKKAFKKLDKAIDNSLLEILGKPDGLDLAVDATYGWIIEGLYLSTEIVAQKNYDPKFLTLLNEQKKSVKLVKDLLDTFKKNPTFAKMVERDQRLPLLEGVLNKLKAPEKVTPAVIDAIRAVVTKERADIIK